MFTPHCEQLPACTKTSLPPPRLSVPGRARRLVGIELASAVDVSQRHFDVLMMVDKEEDDSVEIGRSNRAL